MKNNNQKNIMEEYLLDKDTLGKVIDELMKKHPLSVDKVEELPKYKEEQMRALDDHVAKTLIESLNQDQATSLSELLDQETENPDVFRSFFDNQGINVEQIIQKAFNSFEEKFLMGGQNE